MSERTYLIAKFSDRTKETAGAAAAGFGVYGGYRGTKQAVAGQVYRSQMKNIPGVGVESARRAKQFGNIATGLGAAKVAAGTGLLIGGLKMNTKYKGKRLRREKKS